MKKFAVLLGVIGAIAASGTAVASGGSLLVKNGQTVYLPCNVSGAIDIAAGGAVISDCDGETTIGGAVDVHPGAYIHLCGAHIAGSFLAKGAVSGSYIEATTIGGATHDDGSVGVGSAENCVS